jgi:Rrf2 family nitric oxide-sensitive transcriptional repressor
MRLTRFTDNALRALMFLALRPDDVTTVGEVARTMGMSEDHLLKVVQRLTQLGYVRTLRGRTGGMRLARAADAIVVGEVVRQTEDNLQLVPCFEPSHDGCPITAACGLVPALDDALQAFFGALDRYTVEDLLAKRGDLRALIELTPSGRGAIARGAAVGSAIGASEESGDP